MSLFIFFPVLLGLEIFYFKIADRFNIIDKPNHRSSHDYITIRGGGIIFSIAALLSIIFYNLPLPYFALGLLIISIVSFWDDVADLSSRYRIIAQVGAMSLLFLEIAPTQERLWLLVLLFIVATGIINAFNFMDGINGITGGYALVTLCTLLYINVYLVNFTFAPFIILISLSLLVFLFFNFRTVARCFAGDVGSVSIAFIIVFLLGNLIHKTQDLSYILLLSLYGIDTVITIIERLFKKENIFKPHRKHLYQLLANECHFSHLFVSILYALLQLFFNTFLLINLRFKYTENWLFSIMSLVLQLIIYLCIKSILKKKYTIFG